MSLARADTLLLLAVAAGIAPAVHGFHHGWDCISCKDNSVLVADLGTNRQDFTLEDFYWIDTIADSHSVVFINGLFNYRDYNGTGDSPRVVVARALKARNPKIKVMFYQAADKVGDSKFIQNTLNAHPDWWLRDDNGNILPFHGGRNMQIDPTVPPAQDWFASLSVAEFHSHDEAKRLLDGIMVDGSSWTGAERLGPNVSDARYELLFKGKMEMLHKAQLVYDSLNGGEVIGNPLMEYGQIGPQGPTQGKPGGSWNTTLPYYAGAFDEMFGSFGTMLQTGDWDVVKMRTSFESVINASADGKTVMIHAFPGPAGTSAGTEGMFPTRGNTSDGNTFHVAQWAGPVRVLESADACRAASAARLVESLAPYLIVAAENVFFGYGWFYNMEDGYISCKEGFERGMLDGWFPEYSRPLGSPLGPATTDSTKTVWTREFGHASVFVDLRNRSASKIEWHAVSKFPAYSSESIVV